MINCKNGNIDPRIRSDFILWVAEHAPRPSVSRSILAGDVEVLGGYTQIPPSTNPGWIIKTTSRHGKEYIIAVTLKERVLHVRLIKKIPWEHYNGKLNRGMYCIYDGDEPRKYLLEKVRRNYDKHRSIQTR